MDNLKRIVNYQMSEYGYVRVKFAEYLDKRGIKRNRIQTLTKIKYDVIDRYYKADGIVMVDLDFLAKVCFVLDCKIEDLLEFVPPE